MYSFGKKYKKNGKIFICNNCNKMGHDSKSCKEPKTSWGIILIKNEDISFKNIEIEHDKNTIINGITTVDVTSFTDALNISYYMEKIKFLLIGRKNSLGYIEFIMGRYNLSNIDHLIFLIQQMMPSEIKKIKENLNSFDILWNDVWGNKNNIKYNHDYITSKNLFEKLNNDLYVSIKLEYLLDKIEPLYSSIEFGFPKGRRNNLENEKTCAIREFCEESGFLDEDIRIIDNINPIIENLTGTNGIRYKHVYYVAEFISEKNPSLFGNECQKYEISNVDFYSYIDAKYMIRDYHVEKMNIITKILFYYLEKLTNKKFKVINQENI